MQNGFYAIRLACYKGSGNGCDSMALVKCSECGAKVSDRAESCPKCACPMTGGQRVNQQPGGITIQTEGRASRSVQPTQRHRKWVALLVVTALGASSVAPKFTLWLGIIFSALCVGAFIPVAQSFSRYLLRLDPSKRWQSGSRLVIYGMVGFILIITGWIGSATKIERDKTEAKQAAAETANKASQAAAEAAKKAEKQQVADQANAIVKARVGEAESIWKKGNLVLAEQTLDSASQIPNATDFNPVRELRVRIANSVVETLMAEASSAVKNGDIDAAKTKITAALAMSQSDQLTELRKLDDQIGIATDPIRLRAALIEMSNESFLELKSSGKLPIALVSGYEALDKRATTLAKAEIGNVTEERKKREAQRRREKEAKIARAEANRRQQVAGNNAVATSDGRTIPGLAAVDMHGNLTNMGFNLETIYGTREERTVWICTDEDGGCELKADAAGPGPTEIENVRGICRHLGGGNAVPKAREFLGYIASLPYSGSDPERARKWVESHVEQNSKTTIGGVKFEIRGVRSMRMLLMSPAGP